jgi:hypothetical protein
MTDYLDRDFDLDLPSGRMYSPPPRRQRGGWIWIALLAVVLGAGAYYFLNRRTASVSPAKVAPQTAAPSRPAEPPRTLGQSGEAIELPPLEETDPAVREMVGRLSSHPVVAAWLATTGLVRNVTRVVQAIAEDRGVAAHLGVVRPVGPFIVRASGGRLVIDPRSYRRYDAIATAVSSLEARSCASLYATFRPRLGEAYAELGFPNTPFDATLEDALVTLVSTPVPDDPIEVIPNAGTYAFADRRLEALAPAQKQLLRMGPENARAVKAKLREIALALGVPAERLS